MTTPLIPDFIVKLFEKEITSINHKILEVICKEYSLDFDKAKQTLQKELNINLDIITKDIYNLKISKKRTYGKNTPLENRCIGRVYHKHNNEFVQCIRKKQSNCNTCLTHSQRCPYGTINEPEPDIKEIKKRNIY
jgi:hypothetical protein